MQSIFYFISCQQMAWNSLSWAFKCEFTACVFAFMIHSFSADLTWSKTVNSTQQIKIRKGEKCSPPFFFWRGLYKNPALSHGKWSRMLSTACVRRPHLLIVPRFWSVSDVCQVSRRPGWLSDWNQHVNGAESNDSILCTVSAWPK